MELYAHINGNTYAIALGETLVDNLGEELDSMSIMIPHVADFELKPYDDVYITDSDDYPTRQCGNLHALTDKETFYRHFLVHSYERREVNNVDGLYNFSLSLVSETKFLERIPLPNRTVTNPFEKPGKTVLWLADHFVSRYSPKIKVTNGNGEWEYRNKLSISYATSQSAYMRSRNIIPLGMMFKNVIAMECSFNNPTLREVLTRLFQAKNCIPVVLDGIVFCRDLGQKGNAISSIKGKIWDTVSMNGDQYCDRLRKNYASGLTDKRSISFHEYVGFRNINSPSMRYSDLKIELKYPIYKISKFYACYYSAQKEGKVLKIDLTDFVVPESTRALLCNDWVLYKKQRPTTINGYYDADGNYVLGACDYRFNTVGYSIGSNFISGFGESRKYTENGVDYVMKLTLENILNLGINTELGNETFESDIGGVTDSVHWDRFPYKLGDIWAPSPSNNVNWYALISGWTNLLFNTNDQADGYIGEDSLKMKTIFFEVEYQGFVSSAVTISKDLHDGDVVSIDNQQESMALTEYDGIVSKAKMNRLGNKTSSVTARVADFSDLIDVGDYDDGHGICYKRTISIEKDFISVNYLFSEEYALTNYFTSVFSKYRSSSYASFEQSVERNENRTMQLLLSKDKMLIPAEDPDFTYSIDISDLLSVFHTGDTPRNCLAYFSLEAPKQGIYGVVKEEDIELQHFACDRASYMSGDSICFSFGMPDSETAGTYIRQYYPNVSDVEKQILNIMGQTSATATWSAGFASFVENPINDITGSMQDYLSLPLTKNDGSLSDLTFSYIFSENAVLDDFFGEVEDEQDADHMHEYLRVMPRLPDVVVENTEEEDRIDASEDYKDAKEILSETFQIEPISEDKSKIRFSPLFLKSSNLFSKNQVRIFADYEEQEGEIVLACSEQLVSHQTYYGGNLSCIHSLGLYSKKNDRDLSNLKLMVGMDIDKTFQYTSTMQVGTSYYDVTMSVTIHKITAFTADYITVEMSMELGDFPADSNAGFWPNKSLKNSHFSAKWFNSDRFNEETINANGYTPSSGADNFSGWTPYDNLYISEGQQNDVVAYMQSTLNRACFCFNFNMMPNDGHTVLEKWVLDPEEGTYVSDGGTYLGVASAYDPAHTISQGGSAELCLGMMTFHPCYVYDSISNNGEYPQYPYVENQGEPGETVTSFEGPYKTTTQDSPSAEETIHKNMVYFIGPNIASIDSMSSYSSKSQITSLGLSEVAKPITTENATYGTLYFYGSENAEGKTHLYLFRIEDDGRYHFVFACELDIHDSTGFTSTVYASLIYDRSRTVFDVSTMRPDYKVKNSKGDAIGSPKTEQNVL